MLQAEDAHKPVIAPIGSSRLRRNGAPNWRDWCQHRLNAKCRMYDRAHHDVAPQESGQALGVDGHAQIGGDQAEKRKCSIRRFQTQPRELTGGADSNHFSLSRPFQMYSLTVPPSVITRSSSATTNFPARTWKHPFVMTCRTFLPLE